MASVNNESSFALKKRKLITPIKLNCTNYMRNLKCMKGEKLNCKVLSVMITAFEFF